MPTYERKDGKLIDARTGKTVKHNAPIGTQSDQIPHQYAQDKDSVIFDPDEHGLIVTEEDEENFKALAKQSLSVENLVATFDEDAKKALYYVMALQDNNNPAKKGGTGIAYRADAMIRNNKTEMTPQENVVFDCITGIISSYPDNATYIIKPGDFKNILGYKGENTVYKTFEQGVAGLENRKLLFKGLGPEGLDDITIPWNSICRYHHVKKKGEVAYVEFRPTNFFKALCLASGIAHGAHYNIRIVSQLNTKYKQAVFYYMEDMKNYKQYKDAKPGVFEVTIDEVKDQFNLPESYKPADIKRRVLEPARLAMDSIPECDISFTYEDIPSSGSIQGFLFKIVKRENLEAVEVLAIEEKSEEERKIDTFLNATTATFTDDEKKAIYKFVKQYNRDDSFVLLAVGALQSRLINTNLEPVANPARYLISIIMSGDVADQTKLEKTYKKAEKTNAFSDFSQRTDYDFAALEKALLK